jgi:uncharacterized protein (DUF1697 family)
MPRGSERRESLRTYVALLRGINLGARNKVSMADLRTLFLGLGSEDVETYVQSGNVVFKSGDTDVAKLTETIEQKIRRDLGLSVAVLLRTDAQLANLVAANPFAANADDPRALHVTFLAERPERARVRAIDAKQFEPDEFRVIGPEVYLYCPDGYGRSKLSNAYFEKQLGVAATTRNWNTVTKLTELASG